MFRFPEVPGRAVGSAVLAGGAAALLVLATPTGPAAAQSGDDAVGVVEDLVFFVESLDGSEDITRDDTQVTVTLTSDVLFEFDKAQVTPEARERLERVAEQIREDGAGDVITVAGHTDDQGSTSYNQDLSQRRAEAVRDVLADLLAGESVTFETEGHGESDPRVENDSEENRAKNRRVEITYDVQE